MSVVQRAVLDTQSNQTLAERLIDQLANRIGGLGVELADIAGNVQEVASRVANQSERFHHLQKTAQTMVSANRDIANASQAVQSTTSADRTSYGQRAAELHINGPADHSIPGQSSAARHRDSSRRNRAINHQRSRVHRSGA